MYSYIENQDWLKYYFFRWEWKRHFSIKCCQTLQLNRLGWPLITPTSWKHSTRFYVPWTFKWEDRCWSPKVKMLTRNQKKWSRELSVLFIHQRFQYYYFNFSFELLAHHCLMKTDVRIFIFNGQLVVKWIVI